MKKLLVIILFCFVVIPCTMNAQLFVNKNGNDDQFQARQGYENIDKHGGNAGGGGGEPTPIGSGIAVLLCLSAGYVCFNKRRHKEDE